MGVEEHLSTLKNNITNLINIQGMPKIKNEVNTDTKSADYCALFDNIAGKLKGYIKGTFGTSIKNDDKKLYQKVSRCKGHSAVIKAKKFKDKKEKLNNYLNNIKSTFQEKQEICTAITGLQLKITNMFGK